MELDDLLQGELRQPRGRVHAAVVRLQPNVRQVEQKPGRGLVEEAAQPYRLGELARLDVEEPRDVLHHQRLVQPCLQRLRIGDEAAQELLGVQRREDVVDVVAAVLGVQTLEVLGHPGGAVQLGEGTGARDGALVQRLRQLAQVIVQQQRVTLFDGRPVRVGRRGRVGHREMVDTRRASEIGAEVRVVEGTDPDGGHQTSDLRPQTSASPCSTSWSTNTLTWAAIIGLSPRSVHSAASAS